MKIKLAIIFNLLILLNASSISIAICKCEQLLSQTDCQHQNNNCLWISDKCVINPSQSDSGAQIITYCTSYTESECASIVGCAWINKACEQFLGCTAYFYSKFHGSVKLMGLIVLRQATVLITRPSQPVLGTRRMCYVIGMRRNVKILQNVANYQKHYHLTESVEISCRNAQLETKVAVLKVQRIVKIKNQYLNANGINQKHNNVFGRVTSVSPFHVQMHLLHILLIHNVMNSWLVVQLSKMEDVQIQHNVQMQRLRMHVQQITQMDHVFGRIILVMIRFVTKHPPRSRQMNNARQQPIIRYLLH
ncbi:unnamed protein product (macronuclear) [Paramecium tetraurelia]|uniref:Uncharacterized protein n=1 Tax=Paramecium tetraurelia TaxID=5888 RepID=A0BJS7_PARTE|nr:uncharacterized protein GSPATT00029423001 [Paramecium tetraurelia]CAK58794.1 unnamed protein product [Paramecium tetraurelia]|eukprot:XP_001426192.1 hypothetical protein (macronuclear) [Paramecium tetraurelia strain d4-2]